MWEGVDLAVSSLTDVSVDSRDSTVANFVPLQKRKQSQRLWGYFSFNSCEPIVRSRSSYQLPLRPIIPEQSTVLCWWHRTEVISHHQDKRLSWWHLRACRQRQPPTKGQQTHISKCPQLQFDMRTLETSFLQFSASKTEYINGTICIFDYRIGCFYANESDWISVQ